jgi:hypothetical protein
MKRILLVLGLIILFMPTSFAQLFDDWYDLNFDSEFGLQHLTIDTISNPNNIWQIGAPQKSIFTSAYSNPNVLVTDTVNDYPINDTSIFIITNVAMGQGFEWPHTVILAGQYFVNSDTLTDYGKIDFSPDNGITWIDMLNDTVGYWYWYSNEKPTLTGNSNQWKSFWVNLAELGHYYGVQDGDTILYKFTFISDGIQTNKDGLMYDDLHFEDWVEGIEEIGYDLIKSKCFPNPVKNELVISFDNNYNSTFEFYIYNILGREIYNSKTNSNSVHLSVSKYEKGTYFYKLVEKAEKKFTIGKFLKE